MAKDDGEVKVPTVPAPQVEVVKDHAEPQLPEAVVPDVPALELEMPVADVPEIAEPRTGAVSFDSADLPGDSLPIDFGSVDLPNASTLDVPALESGAVMLNEPASIDVPEVDVSFGEVESPEDLPVISADDFKAIDSLDEEPPLPVATEDFSPQSAEMDFSTTDAPDSSLVQFDEAPAMGSTGLDVAQPMPPPAPDLSAEALGVPTTITLETPGVAPQPGDIYRSLAELEARIERARRFG